MKRNALIALVAAALLVALAAYAYEAPVGVLISSGSSVNNTSTATPFTVNAGGIYAVQCDAAACVRAGSGSSTAASCSLGGATTGVVLAANQLYDLPLISYGSSAADTIAMVSVSGTANCQVFKVLVP